MMMVNSFRFHTYLQSFSGCLPFVFHLRVRVCSGAGVRDAIELISRIVNSIHEFNSSKYVE